MDEDVNQLYQRHLDEARHTEEPVANGSAAERRTAPRLNAETTELTVRAELQVQAIDISVAGLAFFSKFPVQVGQQLQVTLGTMFTVDVEVVFCALEDQDPNFMDLRYKVHCRFPEEEQGKYLLVAIKELARQNKKQKQK